MNDFTCQYLNQSTNIRRKLAYRRTLTQWERAENNEM